MDYSSMTLPPACDGVSPCTDVACQRAIAETHIISETDFNNRIVSSAGAPKIISANDMQSIMDGGSCDSDVIVFNQDVPSNDQLNPQPAPMAGPNVSYSYPCLKGILADGPENFSFYIASGGGPAGRDVMFKVDFGGSAPVRYYDVSEQNP